MSKRGPYKKYTAEFKRQVIETMQEKGMSRRETAREFGVCDGQLIARWERTYLTDGPEGFEIERRGRTSKGRRPTLGAKGEEDLNAEVLRLRAENDYLKNLQALVLEDKRHRLKKRW